MPPTPRGPYTEWFWPTPPTTDGRPGFATFEHTLTPEIDPGPAATYFWAHQFGMEGGEGGYLGLQTKWSVMWTEYYGPPVGDVRTWPR